MISAIKGTIISIEDGQVEVELGGLGLQLKLWVPSTAKFIVGNNSSFYTYLHWNQEQGPTLFGFIDQLERLLFVALIGCSGIGPKMALAILQQLGVNDFVLAIQQQDLKLLSSVSGIGAKKAEQIAIQFKHKIDKIAMHDEFAKLSNFKHLTEVRAVLTSLNYSVTEIVRAMDHIKTQPLTDSESFDVVLRRTLSFLSKSV